MTEFYLGKVAIPFDEIPDAHAVVKLEGRIAFRTADLLLHRSDLQMAEKSLKYINKIPESEPIVREALFRSSIIHLLKCFDGTGARSQLSANKIFAGQPLGKEVFEHFKELRNRTIAHDESSLTQALPMAVINNGSKAYKVEKIVSLEVSIQTLDQGNFNNFSTTVKFVLNWVTTEYEKLCQQLTTELETKDYSELSSMGPVQYSKPTSEDISKRRKRL